MAVYGIDFYGKSYYGNTVGPQFTVAPFTATQPDYGRLVLRWKTPSGDWRFLRLVRSQYGYPVNETDGIILLDADGAEGIPAPTFSDANVTPGKFYYYTIFVGTLDPDTGWTTWIPAGRVQGLPVTDYGYQDRLWDRLPIFHQKLDMLLDEEGDENADLKRFLGTFAFHLDMLRTEYDSLLSVYDTDSSNYDTLMLLGEMYGVSVEPEIPARLNRMRVKNAAYINQQKGTLPGLRNLINSLTGWDADIQVGRNMMLNADQASFVHPDYNQWDPNVVYIAGDRVEFNGGYYQAVKGSYGMGQQPPTAGGTNTWWSQMSGVNDTTLLNPATGGQSTWGILNFTNPGITPSNTGAILLSSGYQSATDPTVTASNALVIKNTTATQADIGAMSVSPVAAPAWSTTVAYKAGNFVTVSGQVYMALMDNTGHAPATSPQYWAPSLVLVAPAMDQEQPIKDGIPISTDDQGVPFVASLFVQSHNRSQPTTAKATPFVYWYDSLGRLIYGLTQPAFPTVYDGFDIPVVNSTTSIADMAADTGHLWTAASGTWRRTGSYVYQADGAAGLKTTTIDTGQKDCSVGVTLRRLGPVGTGMGLVVRYVDANNHVRISQTGITVLSAGTQTSPATFAQPFTDGDRMSVKLSGSNVTVYKNFIQVWTGTITANLAATKHGIYARV